jgi:hypothetical protein
VFHGGLAIVAGGYDDGEWHHVVVTHSSAGAAALYVNGILEGESSVSESAGTYEVVIGAFNSSLDGDLEFHGDISEIAVYPTVLTVDQVQALYAAQFDGYPTERTDERIAFILSDPNLGVGAEWVFTDLEEGQTTMSGVNSPTEVTALEAIQVAADTELGSFFMTGDGYARFHDRYYRLLNQSAAMDTFDSTEYRNVVLGFDDEQIYNDIAVTTSDGSDPFTARDEDSIEAYGRRSLSKSIYPDDENEGYDFAHYLKGLYAEASTRIESIDFRIGADPDLIGTILGAELGNRYNIEVALAGDDLDQDVFLEAITHNISAMKVWDVTFQLSPAVDQTFWLLGVAGSSELGETTILGY